MYFSKISDSSSIKRYNLYNESHRVFQGVSEFCENYILNWKVSCRFDLLHSYVKNIVISYKMLCNFILYPHIIEGGDSLVLFCTVYICLNYFHIELQIIWRKMPCFYLWLKTQVCGFEDIEALQDKATGMKCASYVICKIVKYFVHFWEQAHTEICQVYAETVF